MKAPTHSLMALAALGFAIYMASACGSGGSESLSGSPSSLTGSGWGDASGGGGPDGNADSTGTVPCPKQVYQCGDLIDNDGDGLIDAEDPDCLGPCDDTEGG